MSNTANISVSSIGAQVTFEKPNLNKLNEFSDEIVVEGHAEWPRFVAAAKQFQEQEPLLQELVFCRLDRKVVGRDVSYQYSFKKPELE